MMMLTMCERCLPCVGYYDDAYQMNYKHVGAHDDPYQIDCNYV
jgi:hypothetical protein